MRILIANDDGIDAPGLALAAAAAGHLTDDVWTVAPEVKHTSASQSLTIGRPLTMRRVGERRYSCSGTPADCIVTAMTWLFREGGDGGTTRPDLVISGVNDGPNVAEDIAYSGTLGIAREATFWGVPAIAFSRWKNPEVQPGDEGWLADLIGKLWARRAEWVGETRWLALNLPKRLPAVIRQARIGRDKVAKRSEVLAHEGDVTQLVVPRGRDETAYEGDENYLVTHGFAALTRYSWIADRPLEDGFLSGL